MYQVMYLYKIYVPVQDLDLLFLPCDLDEVCHAYISSGIKFLVLNPKYTDVNI